MICPFGEPDLEALADLRERIRRRRRDAEAAGERDAGDAEAAGGVDGTVTGIGTETVTGIGRDARADADDAMRGAVGMIRGALRGATRERATEPPRLDGSLEGDAGV